ncbi:pumilio homolog 2-like protein, partial [Tanacetum coccineum]
MYRSGSAPPTVEAFSESAGGNRFMSEEELRVGPAYLSYYYSNVNLNPRLPPPLLSKEDWRFTQRLQSGGGSGLGGIGDRRKANRNDGGGGGDGVKVLAEWGGDGLMGLPGLGLGSKQKSLAEIFQDDLSRSTPPSGHPSRPASRTAFEINDETLGPNDAELAQPQDGAKGPPTSYFYAAALGGRANASERRNPNSPGLFNGVSSHPKDAADLVTALSAMNLSNGVMGEESNLTQLDQNANDQSAYLLNMQRNQKNNKNNLYYDGSSANLQSHYQQIDGGGNPYMNNGTSGYSINSPQMMSGQHGNVNLPPLFETAAAAASAMAYPGMDSRFGLESPNMSRLGSQMTGNALQASYMD